MHDKPFLHVDQISKAFSDHAGSRTPVVDSVSLRIEEGELITFLGPSGCGKTTLLRIVGGLETADAGRAYLRGRTLTAPGRDRGMVFQSYSSFPWLTVRDNVAFGLRYRRDLTPGRRRELVERYLALVKLSEFADYYPGRISGGMRQRVAIARTLAADPTLLLMDEPFGALDAQTREFLQFQLLELTRNERKTTIFVTHDVEEAILLADRIIIFSARPATIIDEIRVAEHLPPEPRTPESKESEAFFRLRNRILQTTREQARRTEALLFGAGA